MRSHPMTRHLALTLVTFALLSAFTAHTAWAQQTPGTPAAPSPKAGGEATSAAPGASDDKKTDDAAKKPDDAASPEDSALTERLQKARALINRRQFKEAEPILDAVLKEHPFHQEAVVYISELYMVTKRPDAALALLKETCARPDATARVYLQLGAIYARNKKTDDAFKTYNEAVERFPKEAEVFVRRAQHTGFKNVDSSIADYRKALELNPDHRAALNNLAALYVGRRQFKDARALLLRYRKTNPTGGSGAFNLASVYLSLGQYKEAMEVYTELDVRKPNDPLAISGLAVTEVLSGQPDAALKRLAALQSADGKRSPLYAYAEGLAHLHKGDAAAAMPHLKEACDVAARRLNFNAACIEATRQLGRLKEAEAMLKRQARLGDKALPYAKTYGALVAFSNKDQAGAKAMMGEAIKALPDYDGPESLAAMMRLPPKALADATAIVALMKEPAAANTPDASPSDTPKKDASSDGCGCAVGRATPDGHVAVWMLGLLFIGAVRRRRAHNG